MAMTEPDAFSLALRLHRQGRLTEAEQTCLTVLEGQPTHFAATHLLGIIAMQTLRPELAAQRIGAAIKLCPDRAEPYYNLGLSLAMLNRADDALAGYAKAIALKPDYAAAHNNRGNLLRSLGRLEEALRSYDQAIAHQPDHADSFNADSMKRWRVSNGPRVCVRMTRRCTSTSATRYAIWDGSRRHCRITTKPSLCGPTPLNRIVIAAWPRPRWVSLKRR
jgi:tetratricopeptide (TPR) repeat protein